MGLSCYLKSSLEKERFADFAFLNQKEKATQLRGFLGLLALARFKLISGENILDVELW